MKLADFGLALNLNDERANTRAGTLVGCLHTGTGWLEGGWGREGLEAYGGPHAWLATMSARLDASGSEGAFQHMISDRVV